MSGTINKDRLFEALRRIDPGTRTRLLKEELTGLEDNLVRYSYKFEAQETLVKKHREASEADPKDAARAGYVVVAENELRNIGILIEAYLDEIDAHRRELAELESAGLKKPEANEGTDAPTPAPRPTLVQ